jgi:PII-like signaling protein
MKSSDVTVVRVYLTEGQHLFQTLMQILHDEEKVAGVTAFRGIAGFGQSGELHSATLLDVSLNMPLVLEFFDQPAKVEQVLERINPLVSPGHILSWPATTNLGR